MPPPLRIAAGIIVVTCLASVLIVQLTTSSAPPAPHKLVIRKQRTGPLRFHAVAHAQSMTPGSKIDTDLYLNVGNRTVLLGLQAHNTNGGLTITADHPDPRIAASVAASVARSFQARLQGNPAFGSKTGGTNQ